MKIYDFNDETKYPLSNRDGIYGGNGGTKDGVLIDGEYWFIKYPKTTRGMSEKAQQISYTPLLFLSIRQPYLFDTRL